MVWTDRASLPDDNLTGLAAFCQAAREGSSDLLDVDDIPSHRPLGHFRS